MSMDLSEPLSQPHDFTVSELATDARRLLETHFQLIWVTGEISSFTRAGSGHWYFTLKDDKAQVRCAMFRNRNQFTRYQPKHGDQVRLRAKVSLYEGRGEFQLIGEHIEPAGAGNLQLAFLQLKQKLEAEGLFQPERKKRVPVATKRVALITSAKGAALHDILSVLKRRWPDMEVVLADSPVQGEDAPRRLLDGLNRLLSLHQKYPLEVIVLARGGGSMEDLWAFNSEPLARAIADCPIPTVSAVGHETDFTICDWVADIRAPTPSAAAELISPDQASIHYEIQKNTRSLMREYQRTISDKSANLRTLQYRLRHPGELLQQRMLKADDLELRLKRARRLLVERYENRLTQLHWRLNANKPQKALNLAAGSLERVSARMTRAMSSALSVQKKRHLSSNNLLQALSPMRTVDRGYALLRSEDGTVVTSASQFQAGDRGLATLKDGELSFEVTSAARLNQTPS